MQSAKRIDADLARDFDVIVSFGYRYILSQRLLESLPRQPINLHMSYLPYNRGAHPVFWAFYEGTPQGVTIHHIDKGLDTGEIVLQKRVHFDKLSITFKEAYDLLFSEMEALFIANWEVIKSAAYSAKEQSGDGTFHTQADLPNWQGGWDRPAAEVLSELERSQ